MSRGLKVEQNKAALQVCDNRAMTAAPQLLHTVPVSLEGRSYPILIGSGLLGDASTYAKLPKASSALIVTNTTVAPLYAQQLERALQTRYPQVQTLALPDGEEFKTWDTQNTILTSCWAAAQTARPRCLPWAAGWWGI